MPGQLSVSGSKSDEDNLCSTFKKNADKMAFQQ